MKSNFQELKRVEHATNKNKRGNKRTKKKRNQNILKNKPIVNVNQGIILGK